MVVKSPHFWWCVPYHGMSESNYDLIPKVKAFKLVGSEDWRRTNSSELANLQSFPSRSVSKFRQMESYKSPVMAESNCIHSLQLHLLNKCQTTSVLSQIAILLQFLLFYTTSADRREFNISPG
jgi:hypothetical protein